MENYVYHESEPENRRTSYKPFGVVDFVLNANGRSLVPNSIKIEGDLIVTSDGTTQLPKTYNEVIKFNRKTGIHGAIESISCSTIKQGSLESINNYARFVCMEETATAEVNDAMNASKQVELKSPYEVFSGLYAEVQPQTYTAVDGTADANGTNGLPASTDFSMKPRVCLNRFTGGNLAFAKTGAMKVTLTLARSLAFLYGVVPTNATYELKNLRCCYSTVPTESKPPTVLMNKTSGIKASINSTLANISANVASSAVKGVSVSFLEQAHENTAGDDNYKLEPLPNLQELQFIFNDSLNKYINFVLKSDSEILDGAVNSFNSAGHSNVSPSNLRQGGSSIIGTAFDDFVDMTRSAFEIQIRSDTVSAYNVYMYFHSVLKL